MMHLGLAEQIFGAHRGRAGAGLGQSLRRERGLVILLAPNAHICWHGRIILPVPLGWADCRCPRDVAGGRQQKSHDEAAREAFLRLLGERRAPKDPVLCTAIQKREGG